MLLKINTSSIEHGPLFSFNSNQPNYKIYVFNDTETIEDNILNYYKYRKNESYIFHHYFSEEDISYGITVNEKDIFLRIKEVHNSFGLSFYKLLFQGKLLWCPDYYFTSMKTGK